MLPTMLPSKTLALALATLAAINSIWQRPGTNNGLNERVAIAVAANANSTSTTSPYGGEYGQVLSRPLRLFQHTCEAHTSLLAF